MEAWNKTKSIYRTEEKAKKVAMVIEATEGRLASAEKGPQYGVETKVEQVSEGWVVLWRNVLLPPSNQGCNSGCGGCGSSSTSKTHKGDNINGEFKPTAKILEFRPRK